MKQKEELTKQRDSQLEQIVTVNLLNTHTYMYMYNVNVPVSYLVSLCALSFVRT